MDLEEKSVLKGYICPKKWTLILGIVLCAVGIIAMAFGGFRMYYGKRSTEQVFDPQTTKGETAAYLDIVGLSDWVLEHGDDVYYGAEAANGTRCTVILSKKQAQKLTAQQAYWNRVETPVYPEDAAMEPFGAQTGADTAAYLDIVGLSDWVYSIGKEEIYYAAEDADGKLYTVRLSDETLEQLRPQRDYWDGVLDGETQFDSTLVTGTAYLDVLGISPALGRDDTEGWYLAEDESGYLYVLHLSDAEYAKMEAQQVYWDRESEDEPAPQAYRLHGTTAKTDAETVQELMELLDLNEDEYLQNLGEAHLEVTSGEPATQLPQPEPYRLRGYALQTPDTLTAEFADYWGVEEDAYREYFGGVHLDCVAAVDKDHVESSVPQPEPYRVYGYAKTTGSTVARQLAETWGIEKDDYLAQYGKVLLDTNATDESGVTMGAVLGGFIALLIGLIFVLALVPAEQNAAKCLRALEARGLTQRAAGQLESEANLVIGKDEGRLSQEFLYGRKTGIVVPYDSILWCYRRVTRQNFSTVSTSLILCTRDMKKKAAIVLSGKDKDDVLNRAMLVIAAHNPTVLLGFTNENASAYRQRCRNS